MIKKLIRLATLARRMRGTLEMEHNAWGSRKWRLDLEVRPDNTDCYNWSETDTSLSRAVKAMLMEVEEYYANHWRDDDTPEYECGYGTCG